ncbi:DUF1015 family protein [Flavobacteriaceae sp. LMIT009]
MPIFVPFKAYRPTSDKAKAIACRPYDVLNAKEAKQEAHGNPLSFYHVIKPEIDFDESHNPYAPEIYKKGKTNFDSLVENGVIFQDEKPAFYVYELTMNDHVQTGLVGCCAIDDYFNNVIKKHELTRPDKEEDRKNHIRSSQLNYEPVFLSYPKADAIDALVEKFKIEAPIYDFTADDGIKHRLWIVNEDNDLEQIESLFKTNVSSIYIADGHHRTAAGALVGREFRDNGKSTLNGEARNNYFMAVVFPDNQLKILDYNRVIKDLNGLTEEGLLEAVAKKFDLETKNEAYRPETLHTFGMYLNNQWYKLTAKSGTFNDSDPIGELDVTILSDNVLEPIFNIVDLRKDKRIEFVGGLRGLGELEKRVDSGEMAIAFSMYPVSMKQLIAISDNDLLMPPKVTWFEPKLRSGLFVHDISE